MDLWWEDDDELLAETWGRDAEYLIHDDAELLAETRGRDFEYCLDDEWRCDGE